MTGWAIVGTGRIAAIVAPAIAAQEDAELVAVVSRDQARAEEFAQAHGTRRALTSYEDPLADPDVDAVFIATPNALHADQIVAAARAGKHVFCDKPIATSVKDARRAVEAVREAGVKLGVNFQTRHHPTLVWIRELIAEGAIGEVLIAQCELSPGRRPLRGWRTDIDLAGVGTMHNLGVHGYDLLRYVLDDEVEEVSVMLNVEKRRELETIALALLRFHGGALAYVNANQTTIDQPDLSIYGTEGLIIARSVTRPLLEGGELRIERDGEVPIVEPVPPVDEYALAIADFQEAIRTDREPHASPADGLRSAEVIDALTRSAREGRVVDVVGPG